MPPMPPPCGIAGGATSRTRPVSGSGAAGTSNSTNVRLTRRKSTLFQWLAVPLWVAGGRVGKHSKRNAPNLLAHYPYLWEPTVVRQAIETAWTSFSSGRTFVEVLVPAG